MSRNEKNKKWFIVMAAIIVCFAYGPPQAGAGTSWMERQKLSASDDGAAYDQFGNSVSISGDWAIVGACGDDDKGDGSGSAYMFWWDGTGWIKRQKLLATDGAYGHAFGISVSISGEYAIVGAYYANSVKGQAYIFKLVSGEWIEQPTKLFAGDGEAGDAFGISVSISGNYAIVGARYNVEEEIRSGSAYIFWNNGTDWIEQKKLNASSRAEGDQFGISVSISDDYAIVGARSNDIKGSAYIFERDGTDWDEQAPKLTASDGANYDDFGYSVSISGNNAIVGACLNDEKGEYAGKAYIFYRGATSWSEQAKLTALDGDANDQFGYSVSIDGDYAIIGAPHDEDKYGPYSGTAYIFKWNGTNAQWEQEAKIYASNGAYGDFFGCSVSIDGDNAIVGARYHYDPLQYSGSAYIFVPCDVFLIADLNNDTKVDGKDLDILGDQFKQDPGVWSADFDGDGDVDWDDFKIFSVQWVLYCQQ